MQFQPIKALPDWQWQKDVTFPDWLGFVSNNLPVNSCLGFFGYHGQGQLYLSVSPRTQAFSLFLNGKRADTSVLEPGQCYVLDFSDCSLDGRNTLQISCIHAQEEKDCVRVCIPYPEILPGTPRSVGLNPRALTLVRDLVRSDIAHGFTSAQWALVKDGRLVASEATGLANSYFPDGKRRKRGPRVTTKTLYDLASVTKMFAANYSIQKLVSDGKLDLSTKVCEILGPSFVDDTIELAYANMPSYPGLDVIKEWKASLTLRDLMCHQGGFPPDPSYYLLTKDARRQVYDPEAVNVLYSGIEPSEETRQKTVQAICKTPLMYQPGTKTVYSDVDYMILGLAVEKTVGMDLDRYLKKTFFEPLGLTRLTFNPLQNGFEPQDCAATELQGNTRDGSLRFDGLRRQTLQGQVHDGKAWHSMAGISGHAGLFGNAEELVKLGSVMLCGGYGSHRFFSQTVIDHFGGPKSPFDGTWGIGWWRQGEDGRVYYYGTVSDSSVIGHQGWTGALIAIDPHNRMVLAFLTNKINSPVTDPSLSKDTFDGNWFTTSTLGFATQILTLGMIPGADFDAMAKDLLCDMVQDSIRLIPDRPLPPDHPSIRNAKSKLALLRAWAEKKNDSALLAFARQQEARLPAQDKGNR
ncbi:MAG: serine hydrolase [Clostridia bacterium]|nr:serine hydrolase [Clostridia bacterium]